MAVFSYKARDKRGATISGAVEAVSAEMVSELLENKGLLVVDIHQKKAKDLSEGSIFDWLFGGVSSRDLVIFFRQLSLMVAANLPIVRILRILIRQTENKRLKMAISGVADEVDGGTSLSSAMSDFKFAFGDFSINVIRSGESSGRLSEVVDYLADQQEKDYALESKIRGAMTYPIFIICGLFVVGFLVMAFVIPQTTAMLKQSGVALPLPTKILIGISDFFKYFWWLLLLVVGFGGLGSAYYITRVKAGREWFDRLKLKLPVFGPILQKIYIIRIIRSLDTLLKGGVPVAVALESARDLVSNAVYANALDDVIAKVNEGNSISDGFSSHKEIPIMVSQMISVGEETGKLDVVLDKLADFYTKEVDNGVGNLTTLIEPIVMVILGIAVGCFVAAVILPMWQLAGAM
jgi:type IV pilus assembly protein PilC